MKRIIWTFGIIAGLIVGLMMVITIGLMDSSHTDYDLGQLIGFGTMIVAFSTIYFAIRSYRDKFNEGYIKWWPATKIGLLVTLIASTFYVATWMVIYEASEQNPMEGYEQQMYEKIRNSDMPEAKKQEKLESQQKMMELYNSNPLVRIGITYTEIFPVGLVISIISALILMKKQPYAEPGIN